jgi:class 3 adenylate cyclase/tetratricopeptide (TPR) repeat protein
MPPDHPETPPSTVEEWRQKGEGLIRAGAPVMAYDAVADGLVAFPGDARLRQLLALALARTGASGAAIPLLEALRAEGHADEETIGLLARSYKALWAEGGTAAERQANLARAYDYYAEAYRLSAGIWTGINAATMSLLMGRRDEASEIARGVRDRCLQDEAADTKKAEDYWHLATLAEAWLILRDMPQAEAAYVRAVESGRHRPADKASTRRNARLIVRAHGADGTAIEHALRLPKVVAFAGHIIDLPDRAVPRFPASLEGAAAAAIRDRLARLDAGFGFSAAACGGDILFLEAMRAREGETSIILPYNQDQFERDSVDIIPGADWAERYRRELAAARDIVLAAEARMATGEMSFEYAVLLIEGLAGVRADELDAELVRVVLWDGHRVGGRGGTWATVDRWRRDNQHVEIIDLAALAHDAGFPIVVAPELPESEPAAQASDKAPMVADIVALLFADAKGFSGLREDQIPNFVQGFLGTVADTLARMPNPPRLKNTWGDGLYFVFDSVRDAGMFALDLADAVAATDWTSWGLPKGMSLRTGLHAGPTFACIDPVTGRQNYFGAHVSQTARIEPITPPGQVYASAGFAAVARADGVREFRCEYVGRTPLAKTYGTLPMYACRRRKAAQE